MYELTTHPGLVKARGEMVLLIPEKIHHSILPLRPLFPSSTAAGPCLLSYLYPLSFTQANIYLDHIKHVLVEAE
jgi:ubiquitin-conjugating enzyme E2 O